MLQEQASHKHTIEMKNSDISLWNAILAQNGLTAYMPIIIVIILMFCGISWQIFWTITDPARYQCYALTFWLGSDAIRLLPPSQCTFLNVTTSQAAFHMLPLEYPPLTLVIFSLALFAPIPYYQLAFALLMALTALLIYWLLIRYGPRGAALTFAFYVLVGAWATAEGRFDLIPAALTLLCILAAERKYWKWAYVILAFAVLIKIYPLLLLPALFMAEQRDAQRFHTPSQSLTVQTIPEELWRTLKDAGRWKWKNTLLFFSLIIGVTGIFALLDFQGAVVSQLSYFAQRPVQIESMGSTLLWVATNFGFPAYVVYTFGSLNIMSPLGNIVSFFIEIAFILGYGYTIWLNWRGKFDIVQASIATLLVFVAFSKVFSPQYLIWLMPLIAYSSAFDLVWFLLWSSISLLTTAIYPYLYTRTPDILHVQYVPGFIPVVALRDGLFVLLALAYLFNWFQMRRRKPLPAPLTGRETRPLYIT